MLFFGNVQTLDAIFGKLPRSVRSRIDESRTSVHSDRQSVMCTTAVQNSHVQRSVFVRPQGQAAIQSSHAQAMFLPKMLSEAAGTASPGQSWL